MLHSCVNPAWCRLLGVEQRYHGSYVEWSFKLFYAFVGCLAAAFFTRGTPSAIEQLQRLAPNLPQHVYEIIDLILVLFVGTVVAYVYNPLDPLKAVMAGLGSFSLVKQSAQTVGRRRPRG